jgi:putative ABC transport system ATP-binding protein
LIELEGVTKSYRLGGAEVQALRGISLTVASGEFLALTGTSGSGKSTLLHIIGCLDTPTQGRYWLDGTKVEDFTDDELSSIRNRMVGFVFQSFHLVPQLNVMENVEIPLLYRNVERRCREALVNDVLEKVGLFERRAHRSQELSGGERQRVAIARALVGAPRILLADEPTGNLDQRTGNEIMDVLESLNEEGVTILLVTHDLEKASRARRLHEMRDGRLVRLEPCRLDRELLPSRRAPPLEVDAWPEARARVQPTRASTAPAALRSR